MPEPRPPEAAAAPLRLEAPGGLAPAAMLAGLAAHTVPGAERTDLAAGTHERLVHTAGGPVAVSVQLDADGVDLAIRAAHEVVASVVPAVRAWLDLATDLGPVRAALRADPLLRPLVEARPALRVTGTTDAFQTAVTTVLGQQVSLAAGRTFAGRLVAAYGEPGPHRLAQFPTAAALAGVRAEDLQSAVGLTSSRARTVRALAQALADRSHSPGDTALRLTREELLAVPGVGPWTADYLEVRTGKPDAFAPGDLVLRRALGGISAAEAARRAEAWRPFRAYALVHLWTATAYTR
ncbi:DNA-3-methyladenine glycosylase family protein [Sinomonas soli]